jgi:hypothetical protein
MPNILQGADQGAQSLQSVKYDYDYPGEIDLDPNGEIHKKLLADILIRVRRSKTTMSRRYSSWREIDKVLNAYIRVDDKERKVKEDDERKPVSIVFPYSYAILEVVLTYLIMAFLQEPYIRYEGVSPEDTIGAILLEHVVNLHCLKTKVGLNLHTMFRDALGYGIAPVTPGWEVIHGYKIEKTETAWPSSYSGREVVESKGRRLTEGVVFEGNCLENIDPYRWFPDPTYTAHEPQKGEFCAWIKETNYNSLRREELLDSKNIFNARYVKHVENYSEFSVDESAREAKTGGKPSPDPATASKVYQLYMFWDLIPKEYKLSDSERPEKWMFCVCNDTVITEARKLTEAHGQYPVSVCAPDFDGYSTTPISRLEILHGPQGLVDWLLNTHVANVRKAINDMLIVDPYIINLPDLKKPGPGKLVRVRRPGWGKPDLAMKAVNQLKVEDVTRQNIADAMFVAQVMHKASGADDSMGGVLRTGGPERLTKSEFQGTRAGAIGRLERVAKIIGMQVMQDLGLQFASNTQQYMDQERYIKAIGTWPEVVMQKFGVGPKDAVKVTPYDLLVDYDIFCRDGSIPGGNWNEGWIQLFQTIVQVPLLLQKFDIVRIFKYMALQMGAKNVDDFEIKVMPNEQVQNEVGQGNLLPVGGEGGPVGAA